MSPFLWLLWFTSVTCMSMNKSRVCLSGTNFPYTGYKVENQINLASLSNQFFLVYCKDNKLIYSVGLNETIPWTVPITFSGERSRSLNKLVLARRKTFALRSIPLYMTQTLVGALFLDSNGTLPLPLVADNIFNNWIQLNYKLQMVLHVPILSTPNIDNPKFAKDREWAQYISATETYLYSHDSRMLPRQALDMAINKANSLISNKTLGQFFPLLKSGANHLFTKFILLTKVLLQKDFNAIIKKLDLMLSIK